MSRKRSEMTVMPWGDCPVSDDGRLSEKSNSDNSSFLSAVCYVMVHFIKRGVTNNGKYTVIS